MLIQKAGISNAGPIREPIELEFDQCVNVLIGPNGSGKSTVLKLIARVETGANQADNLLDVHDSQLHVRDNVISVRDKPPSFVLLTDAINYVMDCDPEFWSAEERLYEHGYQQPYAVPSVFIPSIRLAFPPSDEVISEHTIRDSFLNTPNILDSRYVFRTLETYHDHMANTIIEAGGSPEGDFVAQVEPAVEEAGIFGEPGFDSEPTSVEDMATSSWTVNDLDNRKRAVVATAARCAVEICKEIIKDEHLGSYVYRPTTDRYERGITEVRYEHWRVSTTDETSDAITIGDLSSGTQGPLMWLLYLALQVNLQSIRFTRGDRSGYFRELAPNEFPWIVNAVRDDWMERVGVGNALPELWNWELDRGSREIADSHDKWRELPFVLLIDEIENHLHPTWQRRVIPAIRNYFPNAQIFATTHSPFVVAGLKAGQVHLLNRDENGVVTASTNTEDIVGWTADEILRAMMGVDDPTDDETAKNAAELRQLRDEGLRSVEKEEEERQARMKELRRLVNRNMLEGGPFPAQTKVFADYFKEVLERRRDELDSNTENG